MITSIATGNSSPGRCRLPLFGKRIDAHNLSNWELVSVQDGSPSEKHNQIIQILIRNCEKRSVNDYLC